MGSSLQVIPAIGESGRSPTTVDSSAAQGDPLIAAVAGKLKEIGRAATLEVALRVGEVIHREILQGAALVGGKAQNHRSFRQLANHEDTPFSMTALWRSTAIYQLWLRSPELFENKSLGISHYRSILGLPPILQRELLSRAASDSWSKSALERRVREFRTRHVLRGSGRRTARGLQVVHAKLLEWERRMIAVNPLAKERERIIEGLNEMRTTCERLERQLASDVPFVAGEEPPARAKHSSR